MRSDLAREVVDLVVVQADSVDQFVRGAFAKPHRAGAETERGQRLDKGNFGGFADIERFPHCGDDARETVHLTFSGAVFLI